MTVVTDLDGFVGSNPATPECRAVFDSFLAQGKIVDWYRSRSGTTETMQIMFSDSDQFDAYVAEMDAIQIFDPVCTITDMYSQVADSDDVAFFATTESVQVPSYSMTSDKTVYYSGERIGMNITITNASSVSASGLSVGVTKSGDISDSEFFAPFPDAFTNFIENSPTFVSARAVADSNFLLEGNRTFTVTLDPFDSQGNQTESLQQTVTIQPAIQSGMWVKTWNAYYDSDTLGNFDSVAAVNNGGDFGSTNFALTSQPETTSKEFTGFIKSSRSGTVTFRLVSDDMSYMWIGPNALGATDPETAFIKNGGLHGSVQKTATLEMGDDYVPFKVVYGNNVGAGQISLSHDIATEGVYTTDMTGLFFRDYRKNDRGF